MFIENKKEVFKDFWLFLHVRSKHDKELELHGMRANTAYRAGIRSNLAAVALEDLQSAVGTADDDPGGLQAHTVAFENLQAATCADAAEVVDCFWRADLLMDGIRKSSLRS